MGTRATASPNRDRTDIRDASGNTAAAEDPSDEAASKLLYLALRDIHTKWKSTPLNWKAAANQFAIQFGLRFF